MIFMGLQEGSSAQQAGRAAASNSGRDAAPNTGVYKSGGQGLLNSTP